MHGAIGFSLLLMASTAPTAAGQPPDPLPAQQAVQRQREQVRSFVERRGCPGSSAEEEIVVCGEIPDDPIARAYRPPAGFTVPEEGPWFNVSTGSVALSCCAIETSRGTGAGVSLRIRF
jgi:hypothetical protein